MLEEDQITSPPVGRFRWIWASGGRCGESHYTTSPFYASRWHTLDNPMLRNLPHLQRQFQVLIKQFGQLAWINIDPADVVRTPA
jgi:hypothetical protein